MIDILTVEWKPNPFHDIQRERLERHTQIPNWEHYIGEGTSHGSFSHGEKLDELFDKSDNPFVVTLDADAFPVKDFWADFVIEKLLETYTAVAIEHPARGYCHPAFFATQRWRIEHLSFQRQGDKDVGEAMSEKLDGPIYFLTQTSSAEKHPLRDDDPDLGSVYEHMIFHHWYTSRALKDRSKVDGMDNDFIRTCIDRCVERWSDE